MRNQRTMEDETDLKLAKQSLKRVRSANSVTKADVEKIELGSDSTGDPAMWIHLALRGHVLPTSSEAKRIGNFMREVRDDLLEKGVTHRPYFRTREIT